MHNTARDIISKSIFSIGLRTLYGLVTLRPTETLDELQNILIKGESKNVTIVILPSKWAPPTAAHSAFVFKVSALMAGVQNGSTFGKQTLVILPNVTKKDNRKPIIFATYPARLFVAKNMLLGLFNGAAKVLAPEPIYEAKNGEETAVEVLARLLITYANSRGANINVPQNPGEITPETINIVRQYLPKDLSLRMLYQFGGDHFV